MDETPESSQAEVIELSRAKRKVVTRREQAALARLIANAKGDTDQSRRVADFLLAWWNAGTCGSFDLTTLWAVDDEIAADMVTVFALIARTREYPDALNCEDHFQTIVRVWRPELSV